MFFRYGLSDIFYLGQTFTIHGYIECHAHSFFLHMFYMEIVWEYNKTDIKIEERPRSSDSKILKVL